MFYESFAKSNKINYLESQYGGKEEIYNTFN